MIGELTVAAIAAGIGVWGVCKYRATSACALEWQERYKRSSEDLFESRKANDSLKEEKRVVDVELDEMKRIEAEREAKPDPTDYAVTGTPRHIPWSRRKKELEAAARQKRRQIEEFRSQS
jgi:hypothetical protein